MDWICPRRPGVEWQESMWNRLEPGRANDERHPSLGASRSCRPMERNQNGHRSVLPSCPRELGCVLGMHAFPSGSGSLRTRPALERLELCEGKLSCTVLRGVRAGNRPRLPGHMIRTNQITTDFPFATGRRKTCSTLDSTLSFPHQIEQRHSDGLPQTRSAMRQLL